jgi:hypothetical protein
MPSPAQRSESIGPMYSIATFITTQLLSRSRQQTKRERRADGATIH